MNSFFFINGYDFEFCSVLNFKKLKKATSRPPGGGCQISEKRHIYIILYISISHDVSSIYIIYTYIYTYIHT